MKTYIMAVLGVCLASPVLAEIAVVQDDATVDGVYTARVVSKSLVTDIIPMTATETVCERVTESVHTDRYENVIKVIPKNSVRCKNLYVEKHMRVVSGYNVVFDYKGQLKSIHMKTDPGDYIKVKE